MKVESPPLLTVQHISNYTSLLGYWGLQNFLMCAIVFSRDFFDIKDSLEAIQMVRVGFEPQVTILRQGNCLINKYL